MTIEELRETSAMEFRVERTGTYHVNRGLPETWTCPHCGKRNKTDPFAQEILFEHFQVIRHCSHCMYLHIWTLKLTDDFKEKVVAMLLKGGVKNDGIACMACQQAHG